MTSPTPSTDGVPGTAFMIAAFRCWGAREDVPLYRDEVTPLLMTDEYEAQARLAAETFPPAPGKVAVRTRYFDDRVKEAVQSGVRQVVIPGSGLDTRAARIGGKDVRYFEIDTEATLRYKQAVLEGAGLHPNVAWIPGDYVESGIVPLLEPAGFDPGLPTFFLWEGNTTYLPPDQVERVVTGMRDAADQVTVAFDYMAEKVITRNTGHDGLNAFIDHLAQKGAGWVSGYDDIAPLAARTGFSVRSNPSAEELWKTHRPDLPVPSPLFGFYFVCTLDQR